MIQRFNEKLPVCAYCLEAGHTAFKCSRKPRKAMNQYNGLKISSSFGGQRKPMNRGTSTLKTTTTLNPFGKQAKKTAAAVAKWKREYKGVKVCHYCHTPLISGFYAEHMESKARRPDLRTDPKNLVPACGPCNKKKASKSHDEIQHVCDLVK